MGKLVKVERNEKGRKLIITLDGESVIGKTRDSLALSAGEQNFLSLAFEALKAKNSNAEIIVLDDPISSFDSIYKYKIVYALLSSLVKKKVILLTHNLDLVRLVNNQRGKCFSFYIFNNSEGGENGFVRLEDDEVDLMLDLSNLTRFFRDMDTNLNDIKDARAFLIAIVPFMRSYAHITGNDTYNELVKIMHGHGSGNVDIGYCFNQLFGGVNHQIFQKDVYTVNNDDIGELSTDDIEIIDPQKWPLLNKTLICSIDYLKMRLMVEKRLIEEFRISKNKDKTNDIIMAAYSSKNTQCVKNRTKLMAKKTLLNEFNHFEGNLSIFQPAIDISEQQLHKEIQEIEDFFSNEEWKQN